ncbi:complexed with cef1p [Cystobasidiomycetes sp. EMM_F5]
MSTAHRPTWVPAQARDAGSATRQVSTKDQNAYTKLKFRQPGQGTTNDVARRDLKLELERAERIARNKRKGIAETEEADVNGRGTATTQQENEQEAKRRKLIADAAELDRDDSDDEPAGEVDLGAGKSNNNGAVNGKGKGRAVDDGEDEQEDGQQNEDDDDDDDDSDDSEDEEDDEDETAELLRELEKIKRERAEEKARQERERAESAAISAEEAAASGNPLLNLQAALSGQRSYESSSASSASASFTVKKRWDDDVIFKNQAMKSDEPKKEFVNDLIRTQFHRRFLQKYIA